MMETLTLNVPSAVGLTDEQFYQLCIANEPWQLELTQTGELIIIPPTGGESGIRNSDINIQVGLWNRQTKLGKVFDSYTDLKLYQCEKKNATDIHSQTLVILGFLPD